MSKITWTHELRVRLYKEMIKEFGSPTLEMLDCDGRPIGMPKSEFREKMGEIAVRLGFDASKEGALRNQVSWSYREPKEEYHTGLWNNFHRNVEAADEAGYFDVCTQEAGFVIWFLNWFKQLFK